MNKQLPIEIVNIIKNYYLDILSFQAFKLKIKYLHDELKSSQPTLVISEEIFNWFLDFEYAIRLSKLIRVS